MRNQNAQNYYDTVIRLIGRGVVSNLRNLLAKLHASDVAEVIPRLDEKRQDQIIELLAGSEKLGKVFSELGGTFLKDYLERHGNYVLVVEALHKLPSDEVTDLIGQLPKEMTDQILGRMKLTQSETVVDLLQYSATTAGGLMSTEVFKLVETTTVGQAMIALQAVQKPASVFYIYVVNESGVLSGVLSLSQLFRFDAATLLKAIMIREVVRVGLTEPQEEVARVVAQYDLVSVPVVDETNKLLGVVTVDDVIDVIQEEAAENALKMGSTEVESFEEFSFLNSLKKRLPWFAVLVIGGLFNCWVIVHYSVKLPALGVIAGFIPLILRSGGTIARQVSTIVIQAISSGKFRKDHILKIFWQQTQITVVSALVGGGLVAAYAAFTYAPASLLPAAVSLSLFCAMMLALLLGLFLPVLLNLFHLEPAWATGTLLNFVLDVLSIFIYFEILMKIVRVPFLV